MQQIKLIWDLRGPDAAKIAEHHVIHLKEYLIAENLALNITGVETISVVHTIAFLVVTKEEMPKVRDALKPHRGQVYNAV